MSKIGNIIKDAAKEAGLSEEAAALVASKVDKTVTGANDAVAAAAERVKGAANVFVEYIRRGEPEHPEYWAPKNRGTGSDLVCLVTGKTDKFMPCLTGVTKSKAAAERVVKLFDGRAVIKERYEGATDDGPDIVYHVRVGVLHEHEAVLGRLVDVAYTCECVIFPDAISWALDPVKFAMLEPKALYRIRKLQEEITKLKAEKVA